MGQSCTVCRHTQIESINLELAQRIPMRDIAAKYSLSLSAVARHKKHVTAVLAKTQEAQLVGQAGTMMRRIAELDKRADEIYEKAKEGNPALALKALKELREVTALYAKLTGEIQTGTVHNTLVVSPEWLATRAVMLRALEPYPEARRALVAALGGMANAIPG